MHDSGWSHSAWWEEWEKSASQRGDLARLTFSIEQKLASVPRTGKKPSTDPTLCVSRYGPSRLSNVGFGKGPRLPEIRSPPDEWRGERTQPLLPSGGRIPGGLRFLERRIQEREARESPAPDAYSARSSSMRRVPAIPWGDAPRFGAEMPSRSPGPSAYNLSSAYSHFPGGMIPQSPRDTSALAGDSPGPGEYGSPSRPIQSRGARFAGTPFSPRDDGMAASRGRQQDRKTHHSAQPPEYGYLCDPQLHATVGGCLDGQCGIRGRWESTRLAIARSFDDRSGGEGEGEGGNVESDAGSEVDSNASRAAVHVGETMTPREDSLQVDAFHKTDVMLQTPPQPEPVPLADPAEAPEGAAAVEPPPPRLARSHVHKKGATARPRFAKAVTILVPGDDAPFSSFPLSCIHCSDRVPLMSRTDRVRMFSEMAQSAKSFGTPMRKSLHQRHWRQRDGGPGGGRGENSRSRETSGARGMVLQRRRLEAKNHRVEWGWDSVGRLVVPGAAPSGLFEALQRAGAVRDPTAERARLGLLAGGSVAVQQRTKAPLRSVNGTAASLAESRRARVRERALQTEAEAQEPRYIAGLGYACCAYCLSWFARETAGERVSSRRRRQPALLLSAEQGDAERVHRLLRAGADVNTADDEGRTALHRVCLGATAEWRRGTAARIPVGRFVAVMERLLEGNFLADKFFAAQQEERRLVDAGKPTRGSNAFLFNERPRLDDPLPDTGETPLHLAAQSGCPALVTLLVQAGADLHALDFWNRSPRDLSVSAACAKALGWKEAIADTEERQDAFRFQEQRKAREAIRRRRDEARKAYDEAMGRA